MQRLTVVASVMLAAVVIAGLVALGPQLLAVHAAFVAGLAEGTHLALAWASAALAPSSWLQNVQSNLAHAHQLVLTGAAFTLPSLAEVPYLLGRGVGVWLAVSLALCAVASTLVIGASVHGLAGAVRSGSPALRGAYLGARRFVHGY